MEIVLIIVFIVGIAIGCASDETTKKKIRKYDRRLTDFERLFYGEIPEDRRFVEYTKDFEYARLETIPSRLRRLEACYRCRLYQGKDQEDTRKRPQ